MGSSPTSTSFSLDEAFLKVTFEEDPSALKDQEGDPFYDPWIDQASAKFASPDVYGARALRKLYPKHAIVLCRDGVDILDLPGAAIEPASPPDLITDLVFIPLARHRAQVPGVLVDSIRFGSFKVSWEGHDFLLYVVWYPFGFGERLQMYVLHEGPEEPVRDLLVAAGAWASQLHDQIFVYHLYWRRDHNLWSEVQKADWDDIILKDAFKKAVKKDVFEFFRSEDLYNSLAIPWKRGLILYGPAGNGKTITLKAIMKECGAKDYAPLYVKSFQHPAGEEFAMAEVFEKARQAAPCVLVLEDLDALINDGNRSFFLNQLDGLDSNDGLLIIATTNHFDRLDPGLNSRPSRFDRKYLFDDPDEEERALYAEYWQKKLAKNDKIAFPDALVKEVATTTEKFSFAYLKEAFVSTLVLLAGYDDGDKPEFGALLKKQIEALRDQLDKGKDIAPRRVQKARVVASGALPTGGRLNSPSDHLVPIDRRALSQERIYGVAVGDNGRSQSTIPVGWGAIPRDSAERFRTVEGARR